MSQETEKQKARKEKQIMLHTIAHLMKHKHKNYKLIMQIRKQKKQRYASLLQALWEPRRWYLEGVHEQQPQTWYSCLFELSLL